MKGWGDLLASERGIFAIAMLVAATVLAILKIITGAQWIAFAQWIGTALIASKTLEKFARTGEAPSSP